MRNKDSNFTFKLNLGGLLSGEFFKGCDFTEGAASAKISISYILEIRGTLQHLGNTKMI